MTLKHQNPLHLSYHPSRVKPTTAISGEPFATEKIVTSKKPVSVRQLHKQPLGKSSILQSLIEKDKDNTCKFKFAPEMKFRTSTSILKDAVAKLDVEELGVFVGKMTDRQNIWDT